MEPFVAALDEFHRQTAPSDWLEGLVKAYVGDSIASDFYREVAARLDGDTRALVLGVLDDTGHASFAVEKVRAAIEADPRVGGRLALWARRLMGEALSQSQRVVADRDALSTMLVGGVADGFDLAEVGRMFSRITEAHTEADGCARPGGVAGRSGSSSARWPGWPRLLGAAAAPLTACLVGGSVLTGDGLGLAVVVSARSPRPWRTGPCVQPVRPLRGASRSPRCADGGGLGCGADQEREQGCRTATAPMSVAGGWPDPRAMCVMKAPISAPTGPVDRTGCGRAAVRAAGAPPPRPGRSEQSRSRVLPESQGVPSLAARCKTVVAGLTRGGPECNPP